MRGHTIILMTLKCQLISMLVVSRVPAEAANNRVDLKPWRPKARSLVLFTRGHQGPPGAQITGGLFLRPRTEGTSPANSMRPTCPRCPSYSKDVWVSPSVRPWVCRPALNALKVGNVVFSRFCLRQDSDWGKTASKKKKGKQLVILAAIKSHPTQRK